MIKNKFLLPIYLDEINRNKENRNFYEYLENEIIKKIKKTGFYKKENSDEEEYYESKHYDELCEVVLAATYSIYNFNEFDENIKSIFNGIKEIYEINDVNEDAHGDTEINTINKNCSIFINFAHDYLNNENIQGKEYFLLKTMIHEFCHVGSIYNFEVTGFDNVNTTLNEILTVCIEDKLTREFCGIDESIFSRSQVFGKFDFGRDSLDGYPCKSIYGRFIMALENENTLIENYFRLGNQDESTKYGQCLLQEYAPLIHILDTKPYDFNDKNLMNNYITNANNALFSILKKKIDRDMSLDEYLSMTSKLSKFQIKNVETGENVLQESLKMLDVYYFYRENNNEIDVQKLFYGYYSNEFDNFESIICSLRKDYPFKTDREKDDIQLLIEENTPNINNLKPIKDDDILSIEDLNNPIISFKKRKENLIKLNEDNSSSIFRALNTLTERKINKIESKEKDSNIEIFKDFLFDKFNLHKRDIESQRFKFYHILKNLDNKEQFEYIITNLNRFAPNYLSSLLGPIKIEKLTTFTEEFFRNQRYEELQILSNTMDFKNIQLINMNDSKVDLYLDDFLRKSWEIEPSEKSLLSIIDLSREIENIPKDNLIEICFDNISTIKSIKDETLKNIYLEKLEDDLAHLLNINEAKDLLEYKVNGCCIKEFLTNNFSISETTKILGDIETKSINVKNKYINKGLEQDILILSNLAVKGDLNNLENENQLREVFTEFLVNSLCWINDLKEIKPREDLRETYSTIIVDVVNNTKEYDRFFERISPNLLINDDFLNVIKNFSNKTNDYYLEKFLENRNYSEDLAINTLSILLESNEKIAKNLFKNFSDELKENIFEKIDNLEDNKENSKLKEFKEERDKTQGIVF